MREGSIGAQWLEERTPTPPQELIRHATPYLRTGSPNAVELADAGTAALDDSLREAPGEREAAFQLLVADALLTYACESAVDADDCERALEDVLGRVMSGASPER